ncbi:3-carboxymuconate cyclase [Seminavis robusta]|uniref:3-carboxymuconate cyclase n=1 Tax=Seminavis robusta TaxID=568900 RepID=A0A9N8DZM4_9STRA|nr:3-carboxymuconate cyclase [Seminavis robusta]|eukprot:Sro475_g150360.1 3-carboxymuconate cyclase (806) ;mRNA; r:18296-20713
MKTSLSLATLTVLLGCSTAVGHGLRHGASSQRKLDQNFPFTRRVPGSQCPCFTFEDLQSSFGGVPVDVCSAPFAAQTGFPWGGLIAESSSQRDLRACAGRFCTGSTNTCIYRDASRGIEESRDGISDTEEAECILNLQSFCSGFQTLKTDPPTQAPETPSPTTKAPTQAPETPNPTTNPPTRAPETPSPTTKPPTQAPQTPSPTTKTPSQAPETPNPTTNPPTQAPETPSPTTNPPTSQSSATTPAPSAATLEPSTPLISREDLTSSQLGTEQLDLLEIVYLAFGAGNCGEVVTSNPPFLRSFLCTKGAQYKALIQTTGNVQLGIEVASLNPEMTVHQSLCSRDPAIGLSFAECNTRLESFFSTGFQPTSGPSSSSTLTEQPSTQDPVTGTSASLAPATADPSSQGPITETPSNPVDPSSGAVAPTSHVFTMTNAKTMNEVLMFSRDDQNGTIHFIRSFPTGGKGGAAQEGPNDPLASQDSLIVTTNDECILAVNAGSDSVTSFAVKPNELVAAGVYNTSGAFPLSVAENADLVYVLNAGGDGSITGFIKDHSCTLTPVAGSTVSLNITDGQNPPFFLVAPAQIGFTPDGSHLVVLIKGTTEGSILLYPIDYTTGLLGEPTRTRSVGFTPFAFEFDDQGNLLVTEAFGTAARVPAVQGPTLNAGGVSSYEINSATGELTNITSSEGTLQTATCWIRRHAESGCAYTTNNGNANSLSSLRVDAYSGEVGLVQPVAAILDAPLDMSIVDEFLYVLSTGHRSDGQPSIHIFEITPSSCDIDLVEIVTDNIPHENVTVFGVVGMAATMM